MKVKEGPVPRSPKEMVSWLCPVCASRCLKVEKETHLMERDDGSRYVMGATWTVTCDDGHTLSTTEDA